MRVLDSKIAAIANGRMTVSAVSLKTVRTIALSEYKHKLVQGLELLQLHQDREFLGVRNCDSNFLLLP